MFSPQRTVLEVQGLQSASTLEKVERACLGVASVTGLDIDLCAGRVTVTHRDGQLATNALLDALVKAGITAATILNERGPQSA